MGEVEVVIGVDAHKRSHTLVAVDAVGRKLGERTVPATGEGHLQALEWASRWPGARFALEDCHHVTRRLEGDLLAAGCTVVRVPVQLMATARRAGRQPGKSDPIDALAVAHAALREPGLPAARLDGPAREVKLLSDHRHRHGRKRVARLMRQAGLQGRAARRWKKTTIPDPAAAARADQVRRDFTAGATKLDSRWCGDITYIPTWEGWLFLATVIDIASRRVVGYAMADHLRNELISAALGNAVAARDPAPGVIFHSDRGCQYTSASFAGLADDYQVVLSLGRTGQCWDNALAESFFASLKGELIDLQAWPTRAATRRAVVEYIGWYNGTRLHSTLGYLSPAEFEATTGKEDLGQVA